jgi:hypothetical protein
MLVLSLYWTVLTSQHISTANIKGDATQNLDIAVNLYQHGEFSLHVAGSRTPTALREPLPIFITALYLMVSGRDADQLTKTILRTGEPARFVKMHNTGWVFLGLLATWLLFNELTATQWGGGVAAWTAFLFFFNNPYAVDTLYTELATAVLLLVVSGLLLLACRRPSKKLWLAIGVGMGLLSLTKSAFLYIALGTVLLMWVALMFHRRVHDRPWLAAGLMALGLALTTVPWMIRNHLLFDSPQISVGRSGWVLYKRALINQVTPEEFRYGFTLFGPRLFQDMVAGTTQEIQLEDFKQAQGRLSRLYAGASAFSYNDMVAQTTGQPDRAISFYRQTSAMHVKLSREMQQAGHRFPNLAADQMMQSMALRTMADQPLAHLKLTSLMFWRAMWSFPPHLDIPLLPEGRWRSAFMEVLNAVAVLSLLACFVLGLVRRNVRLLAITSLPVLMMAFYTLLSQNLPRFFAPAQPLMLVAVLLLVFHAVKPRKQLSKPC